MSAIYKIGRVVFGGFFLYSGINHFLHRDHMAQYTKAKGVPQPEAAVIASGALLTLAGASLIFGFKPKLGSAAVSTFLATASPLMHDFWKNDDPAARQNDLIHFSKNIALLGAALALHGSSHQERG
jgi:putative oxidoreductase